VERAVSIVMAEGWNTVAMTPSYQILSALPDFIIKSAKTNSVFYFGTCTAVASVS
jgi:hypothetical protein